MCRAEVGFLRLAHNDRSFRIRNIHYSAGVGDGTRVDSSGFWTATGPRPPHSLGLGRSTSRCTAGVGSFLNDRSGSPGPSQARAVERVVVRLPGTADMERFSAPTDL